MRTRERKTEEEKQHNKKIGKYMLNKSGVHIVEPKETVGDTLSGMVAADVGSVLVLSDDQVVGIVTERDVLKHWKDLSNPNFSKQPITKIMTAPVFCLLSHEIHRAATVMLERKIRHIPILGSEKKLIGIMSIRDVLRNYHLYSRPKAIAPSLNPLAPNATGKKRALHLLAPTLGLDKILSDLFGQHFEFRVWDDAQMFLNSSEFKELGNAPLFLDIDKMPKNTLQDLLRIILSNIATKQPRLFVFLSLHAHGETEVEALREISKKVNWHVYARPVSIAALINDLAELKLAKQT